MELADFIIIIQDVVVKVLTVEKSCGPLENRPAISTPWLRHWLHYKRQHKVSQNFLAFLSSATASYFADTS